MKRLPLIIVAAAVIAAFLAISNPVSAQEMGTSQGYDLDALWSNARSQHDLTTEDAIVLLESRAVTIEANGNKVIRVHRVVWIGTAIGIRSYADLRVPWNSATSTLDVFALRTWREDRWWPDVSKVSETAVVETLPYAVALADDYTSMRETMLLHDGVELPCIMETVYEIEARSGGGATGGADGRWVFPQRDPAIHVEYTVTVPAGVEFAHRSGNGAPAPVVTKDGGAATYQWTMEYNDRLGTPLVAHPAGYAPSTAWSTWKDWQSLATRITSTFDEAAVLDAQLADTVAVLVARETGAGAKARAIASYIDESTRSIHTDTRFWAFNPRAATRTWETAYGHGLDRAVLAASMFRHAGLEAGPVYRSITWNAVSMELPGMSGFGNMQVFVRGDRYQAIYDPEAGTLTDRVSAMYDGIVWSPGTGDGTPRKPDASGSAIESRFEVVLTLEPAADGGWNGRGYIDAEGVFSPYGEMTGLDGEALAAIGQIAESVLPGAKVGGFNPEVFDRGRVTAGFDFGIVAGDPDGEGRTAVTTGNPAGGISSRLPADVHLYNEHRGSPVMLPGVMTQRVVIRIRIGERELAYLPEATGLSNSAGQYQLAAEHENGWITVERTLTLNAGTVEPGAWPELRALLLEDADSAGRTILFR